MKNPKRKRRILVGIGLVVLLAGIKIYFEIGNHIYKQQIGQMETQPLQATAKTLSKDGYDIHYFVSGNPSGETLIFLHPAFGDHTCFDKQAVFFAQNFQVVTLDLLGHGLSQAVKTKHKIDQSATHLREIMQQEAIGRAHIVGVSMGSLIAQDFAQQYPDAVLSLTALGGYNINHDNQEINRAQGKEMFRWLFKVLFSMDAFRRYTGSVSAITAEAQAQFFKSAQGFTRKSFPLMSGLGTIIKEREQPLRPYPLLILAGDHDLDLAKQTARQWHDEEPESRFLEIEQAGHCANMDNAEKFNDVLSEFISNTKKTFPLE